MIYSADVYSRQFSFQYSQKNRLCRRAQNSYIEKRSAGLVLQGDAIVSEGEQSFFVFYEGLIFILPSKIKQSVCPINAQ